jgi:hypothetical protein
LFLHLVAFALAFAEIVRADWQLLRAPRIDVAALDATARLVGLALLALWVTGLGLVGLETAFEPSAIAAKPKLVAKLFAVTVLTGNGLLLHHYAFPALRGGVQSPARLATTAALGAISSVSWTYAAFAGSARLIAGALSVEGFLLLYGFGLTIGIGVAVLAVAPTLQVRLAAERPRTSVPAEDEARWAEDAEADTVAAPINDTPRVRESA